MSLGFVLMNCAQAKPIEFDSSHSQIGLFINALTLRASVSSENSPFFSLEEGRTTTVEIPISSHSNLNKVKIFKESNVQDALSFSEDASVLESSTGEKVDLQLSVNTDLNCEDEDLILNVKDEEGNVVGKANVRILDSDKCMFFATGNGAGYDGNLGGLQGADGICQSEKGNFLPGDKSEYRALLSTPYQRRPSLNLEEDGRFDWPVRKNLRYYIHSNDSSRSQYLFGTSFPADSESDDPSGIFSIPLTENLPASLSPTPARIWTGYYNLFQTGVNCLDWTSNNDEYAALAMTVAFNDTYNYCDVRHSILCVRL